MTQVQPEIEGKEIGVADIGVKIEIYMRFNIKKSLGVIPQAFLMKEGNDQYMEMVT